MKISKSTIRLILTGVSMAGVWITSYFSAKGKEAEKPDESKKEKIKHYIPAIVSGAVTTVCIGCNHKISSNEIAALATTASFAIAHRDKLQEVVKKELGEDKAKEIEKETIPINDITPIENTGRGSTKFLDLYSGRKFYSNMDSVKKACKSINRRLSNGEFICYNDLFQGWGLTRSELGENHGWIPSEDCFEHEDDENIIGFDFDSAIDFDGSPLIVITMEDKPSEYWDDGTGMWYNYGADPLPDKRKK
jgi:hypothetical protein